MKKKESARLITLLLLFFVFGPSSTRWAEQERESIGFVPGVLLPGVGVGREQMTEEAFSFRVRQALEAHAFSKLRDPEALAGAIRIVDDPELQAIFASAAEQYGVSKETLEALVYVESNGIADAVSPTGPAGAAQMAKETAKRSGINPAKKVVQVIVSTAKKIIGRKKGKPVYRDVEKKTTKTVTVDERLDPSLAIPAAARHLSEVEKRFGNESLAIAAYHCGEGCISRQIRLSSELKGFEDGLVTAARLLFFNHPGFNPKLYQEIERRARQDGSPTYWFRIKQSQQILALYRHDRKRFNELLSQHANPLNPGDRNPQRLWASIGKSDLVYKTWEDLKNNPGNRLVYALNDPEYFGFTVQPPAAEGSDAGLLFKATPEALGTLAYVAFETRRLQRALGFGYFFEPLSVTALVLPARFVGSDDNPSFPVHTSGQVFDIYYGNLSEVEVMCLRFVLEDLGLTGYIGFVEHASSQTIHVGPLKSGRSFFTNVYREARSQGR